MSGLSAPADRSVLLEKQSDDDTSVPEGELMVARPGGSRLFNTGFRPSSQGREYHEIFRLVPKRLPSRPTRAERPGDVANHPIRRGFAFRVFTSTACRRRQTVC